MKTEVPWLGQIYVITLTLVVFKSSDSPLSKPYLTKELNEGKNSYFKYLKKDIRIYLFLKQYQLEKSRKAPLEVKKSSVKEIMDF